MSGIDYREIALSLERRKRRRGAPAPVDPGRSIAEQIQAGILAEIAGDRANMLGVVGVVTPRRRPERRRERPSAWSLVHVMDRLEEAWLTLGRLPVVTRPRGFANAMPAYVYDRFDLNAQFETHELERTMRTQNRVRRPPSPDEVTRMDEAFGWPLHYLGGAEQQHLARAVNLCTRWAAHGFSRDAIEDECKRLQLNVTIHQLYRRKVLGLQIICRGLVAVSAPVT